LKYICANMQFVYLRVCIFNLTLEGDLLMKNFIFLMLTFSTFMAAACEEDTQSVGGPVTDGATAQRTNSSMSSELSATSGEVGLDCAEDLGTITVRGFFLVGWGGGGLNGSFWSQFPPINALLTLLNLAQDFGCDTDQQTRELYANMVFSQESALALAEGLSDWAQFLAEHPPGSDYTVYWPDGSTATYYVTNPRSTTNPTFNETSMSGC